MASLTVPKSQASSLKPQEFVWTPGKYRGIIEAVNAKPLPSTNDGEPFAGYVSTQGKLLGIRIGNNEGLEHGMDEPGNRKRFVDIVVADGPYTIFDADLPQEAWQLRASQRLATNLALYGLDVGEEDDEGNVTVPGEFFEALENGQFVGKVVMYISYNRSYKNRRGEEKVAEGIETFCR